MKKKIKNKYQHYIVYLCIYLVDIVLTIYCATKNKVNYVRFLSHDIMIGKFRDMLFGRNYVNLIIICFFYLYLVLVNKYLLKRKNSKKFMIFILIILIIINLLLFYIFTKRIY